MKNSSFVYKTKNDYLKYGKRSDIHTTIREDIYDKFRVECFKAKQPTTKALDVVLKMILENENLLKEFHNNLKKY